MMFRSIRKKGRSPSALDSARERPRYINNRQTGVDGESAGIQHQPSWPAHHEGNVSSPRLKEGNVGMVVKKLQVESEEHKERAKKFFTESENQRLLVRKKDSKIVELEFQQLEMKKTLSQLEQDLQKSKKTIRNNLEEHNSMVVELTYFRKSLTEAESTAKKLDRKLQIGENKLFEMNMLMAAASSGDQSETTLHLFQKTAECNELSMMVESLSRLMQEKDDQVLKMKKAGETNNVLIKQLHNMFPGAASMSVDEEIDAEGNAVLLMNMMNMLNDIQSNNEKTQKDRNAAIHKAGGMNVELDECRTQLAALKQLSFPTVFQWGGGNGDKDSSSHVPLRNGSETSWTSRPTKTVLDQVVTPPIRPASLPTTGLRSNRDTTSRLLKYLKHNLVQEVEEDAETEQLSTSSSHSSPSSPHHNFTLRSTQRTQNE